MLSTMNAINFASSYELLQPSERSFVDDFLRALENEAEKRFERLTTTLERVTQSIDPATLDERTRGYFSLPMVRAAIRERVEQMARERDLTPQRIVQEHAVLALANMDDFIVRYQDGRGAEVDLSKVSRAQMSAVQQIETEETYGPRGTTRKIKLKLYNKQVSLDALAKFTGLDKADNVEYAAYKTLPKDMVKLPASASVEQLADDYARLIGG